LSNNGFNKLPSKSDQIIIVLAAEKNILS